MVRFKIRKAFGPTYMIAPLGRGTGIFEHTYLCVYILEIKVKKVPKGSRNQQHLNIRRTGTRNAYDAQTSRIRSITCKRRGHLRRSLKHTGTLVVPPNLTKPTFQAFKRTTSQVNNPQRTERVYMENAIFFCQFQRKWYMNTEHGYG